jgi:glycosyltransferase involved in cell wall biosynthesis
LTIAVSKPLQRQLRQFGVTNSIYLPNSIDTSSINPSSSRSQLSAGKTILFVGDLIALKRPLLLIRAFERVLAKIPEANLTMVGEGPLEDPVHEEVLQRGLAASVKFFPRVAPEYVIQLLLRASVFVLPSVNEGLSLALLEAMAAGQVIVASANESHLEILQSGTNAFLFQPDNEEELVEHLISALTNDRLRSKLSQSARQLCLTEFSNSVIGRKLEEIYMNAILIKSQ